METNKCPGYFQFRFTGSDWRNVPVMEIIAAVKQQIPKDKRDYDPDEFLWTIDASEVPTFMEIWEQHTVDPQQEELF